METNEIQKHMNPNESMEESLYEKLMEAELPKNQYERRGLGEDMEVVYDNVDGWWKPRYILNHEARTAFEFMSGSLRLLTVGEDDIEWSTLENLSEDTLRRARIRSALLPTSIENFYNGVAQVKWQINPDGRYYMDDDGYGMTDDEEVELYGYINKLGTVVGKFHVPRSRDDEECARRMAEENALVNEEQKCENQHGKENISVIGGDSIDFPIAVVYGPEPLDEWCNSVMSDDCRKTCGDEIDSLMDSVYGPPSDEIDP